MFNRHQFLKAVSAVENLDVFTLTKKMENLNLGDKKTTSSSCIGSSSSSNLSMVSSIENHHNMYSSIFERFKLSSNPSEFTRKMMEFTKSPFIDIPKTVMELTSNSSSYILSLGFRFMPGQGDFLFKNLRLPESLEGLKGLRESLGLTLAKDTLSNRGILKFNGFSEIQAKGSMMMNRVLLEAITFNDGFYGRFLVLAQIGVGCTVWYGFTPGAGFTLPFESTSLFSPIENYEPFFYNPDVYIHPGFQKMTLMENQTNTISALSTAYTDEKPFLDIKIPSNNSAHLIVGITLGLVIVVLLSVGLSPIAE